MTRKDYERAVKHIRAAAPVRGVKRADLVTVFARFFQEDNPRFSHDRFYDACMGQEGEEVKQ